MMKKIVSGVEIWILSAVLFSCSNENVQHQRDTTNLTVIDDRLELTRFAEDPDIVTPIGIAIDKQNRIFVLESHTHLPPSDYPGPDSDRIKLMRDNDAGQPDSISVFAEGFEAGMNITISPEGHLYLVTASEVWVVYDRDGDGRSEERNKLIEFTKPDYVYAHAGLMGITFSNDGWMYISRGNVGGQGWKLVGRDSSSVEGYGDGGNIIRARPDGTELQEVATGFWNPFDLKFDHKGRLLAADNDPDSRGPNRLVHIIQGSDYGYKSLYGNSGIHPYLAWNGELPGTLPYAVGLGEAPTGLLDASSTSLPGDYQGQMITSIWEESRIVRINLAPKGVSLTGNTETIIQGGPQFRPVSFASDTSGTIYFTDWVIREYPNHGKGRIWKLTNKTGEDALEPKSPYANYEPNPEGEPLQDIYASDSVDDFVKLRQALTAEDPFRRNAAITVLSRPLFQSQVVNATRSNNADIRLGAMIALHRSGYDGGDEIARRLLVDPDQRIRQYALKWIGREGMTSLRSELDRALTAGAVSEELFKTYLATVRHLRPEFVEAYQNQTTNESKGIERRLPSGFIESFIQDQSRSIALRAMAVKYLENPRNKVDLLVSLLYESESAPLRLEVVRTLAMTPSQTVAKPLLNVILDRNNPTQLRAEALAALERQPVDLSTEIIPLLEDEEEDVQIEAARYLRTKASNNEVKSALKETYSSSNSEPLKRQIAIAFSQGELQDTPSRPGSLEEWQTALSDKGDPERGRRVFFSVHSTCSTCHAIKERGGDLGPNLTNAGQSKTREQLIHSILRPSDEISPQWQGWYIEMEDGTTHRGRQINVGYDDIELYTQAGEVVSFEKTGITDYGVAETSLMPPALETRLTINDMQDLVSFLEATEQ
ncbi:c-type cytochrome [Aliifodinibius sp. S!AR15-10]|uniref:PVC-type heme-binding CxxCH protein n=1 Tax=Aliifodinibius sp. S!AR15-10 TaxID=2950437 RepID=UPI00285CC62A|nr:PVC-type heme-binding CxxCH protein [Aliifodinibius sp. S!AR15-10]MDR8392711.1 c-type cytochrome [Aliifodinibius sp. S!AR15-10]